jgi:glyoxylase I family protein
MRIDGRTLRDHNRVDTRRLPAKMTGYLLNDSAPKRQHRKENETKPRGDHVKNQSLLAAVATLLVVTLSHALAAEPPKGNDKQRVLGIGGLFFKAENPESLARWYETHLGISLTPTSYGQKPWLQEAGPTVFAPFKKSTTYFGKPEQRWMINFRVADLKAMVAQLRAIGITVDEPASYPNGDFAGLQDPEGNPIELWQPKEPK